MSISWGNNFGEGVRISQGYYFYGCRSIGEPNNLIDLDGSGSLTQSFHPMFSGKSLGGALQIHLNHATGYNLLWAFCAKKASLISLHPITNTHFVTSHRGLIVCGRNGFATALDVWCDKSMAHGGLSRWFSVFNIFDSTRSSVPWTSSLSASWQTFVLGSVSLLDALIVVNSMFLQIPLLDLMLCECCDRRSFLTFDSSFFYFLYPLSRNSQAASCLHYRFSQGLDDSLMSQQRTSPFCVLYLLGLLLSHILYHSAWVGIFIKTRRSTKTGSV